MGDWARELDRRRGDQPCRASWSIADPPRQTSHCSPTPESIRPARWLKRRNYWRTLFRCGSKRGTLAIYGDAGETRLDEASPLADGPPQMTDVAKDWEAAVEGANASRVVILRTSVVLEKGTPALERLLLLVRLGLGGRVASGRQWTSWIHIDDWLSIVRWALEPDSAASGGGHRDCPGSRSQFRTDGRAAQAPSPATLRRRRPLSWSESARSFFAATLPWA